MDTTQKQHYDLRIALGIIIGFTVFRAVYAGFFPLAADEAYYWQWSRYMAPGYYDHSPMIAWTIRMATWLFGHTEFAVRLPTVLAVGMASVYLMAMANRWFSPQIAVALVVLTQSILIFNVGALLATPDGLLALGWAGASYHLARGYEDNRWSQWLWGGFWFGFGLLSKYTMAIFPVLVFCYGIFSEKHRRRLGGCRPWIGFMAGMLMFAPVIYWNSRHHWHTFRHVGHMGGVDEGFRFTLRFFGDYIGAQAALLSPVVFVLILWAWMIAYRQKEWIYRYLFWTSCPVFLFFMVLSFKSRVYGNWPATGYLTASVLIAVFFGQKSEDTSGTWTVRRNPKLWKWALGTSYLFTGLILLYNVWPALPIPQSLDRVALEMAGWKELGQEAKRLYDTMPNKEKTFYFARKYQDASQLAFYTPGRPRTVSINRWDRPNQYDFWQSDDAYLGWDAVGVTGESMVYKKDLEQVFDRVEGPVKVEAYRDLSATWRFPDEEPMKVFFLFRAYHFNGGLRWRPPNDADIRAD